MKKHYHHLSHKDRITTYKFLYQGYSILQIATVVDYHKSAIYRELHRYSFEIGHKPG